MPKKRGNGLGIWFFKTTMRLAGLRGAYALLYPVCFWCHHMHKNEPPANRQAPLNKMILFL